MKLPVTILVFTPMLILPVNVQAVSITTIASITTVAANTGAIVKEAHDVFRHPVITFRKHVKQVKDAAKGKGK